AGATSRIRGETGRARSEDATMTRRWFLAALAMLGLAGSAAAQAPPPMPLSQGPSTPQVYQPQFAGEPMPVMPGQFCPAPAPDSPVSLPNDGSPNSFSDDCECGGQGVVVSVGGIGLMRQHLGNRQLGFLDPGINILGTQIFADTGILPPAGTPPVLNLHDVSPDMHFGGRASVQWREGDYAFELCGFYIP